ncbi:hypothetical protein E2320_006234 [Naja naja]|nr:hypothetical protein E2320_006234 [Naja naja]
MRSYPQRLPSSAPKAFANRRKALGEPSHAASGLPSLCKNFGFWRKKLKKGLQTPVTGFPQLRFQPQKTLKRRPSWILGCKMSTLRGKS